MFFQSVFALCIFVCTLIAHEFSTHNTIALSSIEDTSRVDLLESKKVSSIQNETAITGLDKRVEYDYHGSIEQIVNSIYDMIDGFGIGWIIREPYFKRILSIAEAREKHYPMGVFHMVSPPSFLNKINKAFCAKERNEKLSASRRLEGEGYISVRERDGGHTVVTLIVGDSQHLPDDTDTCNLCAAMDKRVENKFESIGDRSLLTSKDMVELAWEGLPEDGTSAGCFSIFQALVSSDNRIDIFNLGLSWAGLYREGKLIQQTTTQTHEDGSQIQLCNAIRKPEPEIYAHLDDGIEYNWYSRQGDIFVVVSEGVREHLDPEEILGAFSKVRDLGDLAKPFEEETDFDLISMGIVKAARIEARDYPEKDMLAITIGIGNNR